MDLFSWADMELEVLECTKCSLSETRNHPLFGEGSLSAKILIIAEAPGIEEDLKGRIFIGKSGQLLDKIFQACGFNREKHLYITNVLKCHSPNNKDPKPDEIKTCLPYLRKQIDLLNPPIILILGRVALQSIISPNASITKMRGNWIEWNGHWVMPTFHPSALLRNPNLKKESWEDFKKLVYKYRELIDPDHQSPNIK